LRRALAALAAASFVAALVIAPTASSSRFIKKGIFDDAQILYGNPDRVFPLLQSSGSQVIRVDLWWGEANGVARRRPARPADPADPAYDWATYDRTVTLAKKYGQIPIFTIMGTPAWANSARGWNAAPNAITDLQAFATAAARRYSGSFKLPDGTTMGRVAHWTAWNEPNNPVFLKPQFVRAGGKWVLQSARDYARICNAVVVAVKSVNQKNLVACGMTAPRGNNQPGTSRSSASPIAFLRAMKLAGAKGFDAYGHHPYYGSPSETPNTKPPPGKRGAPPTAVTLGNFDVLVKDLTRLYGNVRIWVTEYGYQTNPPDGAFGVSEAKQALYMRQAWEKVKRHPRVDMFIWFLLRDEQRIDAGWQSGIFTSRWARKIARETFESLRPPG
jgi:hypothetical protein